MLVLVFLNLLHIESHSWECVLAISVLLHCILFLTVVSFRFPENSAEKALEIALWFCGAGLLLASLSGMLLAHWFSTSHNPLVHRVERLPSSSVSRIFTEATDTHSASSVNVLAGPVLFTIALWSCYCWKLLDVEDVRMWKPLALRVNNFFFS